MYFKSKLKTAEYGYKIAYKKKKAAKFNSPEYNRANELMKYYKEYIAYFKNMIEYDKKQSKKVRKALKKTTKKK